MDDNYVIEINQLVKNYKMYNHKRDRIIEISPYGYINHRSKYEDYLSNPAIIKRRNDLYKMAVKK